MIIECRRHFRFLVANVGAILESGVPAMESVLGSPVMVAAADVVSYLGLGHPVSVSKTIAWSPCRRVGEPNRESSR